MILLMANAPCGTFSITEVVREEGVLTAVTVVGIPANDQNKGMSYSEYSIEGRQHGDEENQLLSQQSVIVAMKRGGEGEGEWRREGGKKERWE